MSGPPLRDGDPAQDLATAPENPEAEAPVEVSVMRETLQSMDRYWFGFGSATAMGLIRILICSLTVVALLMLLPQFDDWFTERGFVPAWLATRFMEPRVDVGFGTHLTIPRISLLSGVTDPRISLAFLLATISFGVLSAVGLWTRLSTVLLAIGVVSLQHRNPAILHGGDSVMRICCLYVAVAPSGRACSLDRLTGLWKGRISAGPPLVSMWPQRILAYNVALIYLTTTWLKWEGVMWRAGTATYYTSRIQEFHRFPVPSFMGEFPFVYFATYATLAVEFALGTLVFFKPLRRYVLIAGLLLHVEIDYSMNIPLFSLLMVSTYVSFYDGEEVSGWARRLGRRLTWFRVGVRLPAGSQLKPAAAAFLGAVDPLGLIEYEPGATDAWTAHREAGPGMPARRAMATRSLGAWFFGWIPGIWIRMMASATEPQRAPEAL